MEVEDEVCTSCGLIWKHHSFGAYIDHWQRRRWPEGTHVITLIRWGPSETSPGERFACCCGGWWHQSEEFTPNAQFAARILPKFEAHVRKETA